MKRSGIRCIFYEELLNPRVAETIAQETGAELLQLSAAHNLSKKAMEQGVTFIDIMEQNLKNLSRGLECREKCAAACNLCFKYDGAEILHGVTLTINAGDYIGLVGPNGSGKTTFIRTILGLLKPTSGEVALFGCSPSAFTGWEKIGYLPQKLIGFNPWFPALVREIVSLGLLGKKSFPRRLAAADAGRWTVPPLLDIEDIQAQTHRRALRRPAAAGAAGAGAGEQAGVFNPG